MTLVSPCLAVSQQSAKPEVSSAVYFDVSPPLKSMCSRPVTKADLSRKEGAVKNYFRTREHPGPHERKADQALQKTPALKTGDTILRNFEGMPNISFVVPADPCGAVGPDHYVQVVNFVCSVYDKTGNRLMGPFNTGLLWMGLPHNSSNGDGIVLYDGHADRWLISQLSLPDYPNGPFYQMIAVSQTPDPTGSWYRYEFAFADIPDYPKFGTWHDGYYMSYNRIRSGGMVYDGTGSVVFERSAMLTGNPDARMILFLENSGEDAFSMLPADCEGSFPDASTPEFFFFVKRNFIGIQEFHADWTNPAASTFGNYLKIPVSPFQNNTENIPQKGSGSSLNPINDRLMFRMQYRKFSDHQSVVVNHTVDAGGHTGIRWYELRRTSDNWYVFQESTFAPDTNYRWMGSAAMDTDGNIALGYSVAGPGLYPSVRYTGRMAHDPLNRFTIAEREIIPGGGAQTGVWSSGGRWGDYSCMSADPAQPQVFWYTQEYYDSTSVSYWKTRIASFSFAGVLTMNATATPGIVCKGESSALDILASGGTGNYSYQWRSLPDGFTSGIRNPVVSPIVSTKYIATVGDGSLLISDTLSVGVLQPPAVSAGSDTSCCHYIGRIALRGLASDVISTIWTTTGDGTFGDAASLNTTYFPGFNDKTKGAVSLYLAGTPQPPCLPVVSERHITFEPCAGTEELPAEISADLFPNPTSGRFILMVGGTTTSNITFGMTNLLGSPVSIGFPGHPVGSQRYAFNISHLPGGIYFLRFKTGETIVTRKLILAR